MISRLRPGGGPVSRMGTRLTGGVAAVFAVVLALLSWAPATAAAVTSTGPLTCFAVDVSGSNLVSSSGEPPSDPGPVFVRQQVVELFGQVLADLGDASGQRLGVVTFGTGLGTRIGPLAVSASANQSELTAALPNALRPSAAEAAWMDWVAGVRGCQQMFRSAGTTQGMVVLLTDGFPQGPAGDPATQLAAIKPMARQLWADGITIQPVLYGAAAGQPGSARQAMIQLAALGHGHLVLASTPLAMLRAALSLASLSTGLPLGGSEVQVNGSTTIPIDVAPQVSAAVLVVLRSSSQLRLAVTAPDGKPLASAADGTSGLGLVVALAHPATGSYQASADGQGSVFAAELLRYAAVAAPSSVRPPTGKGTAQPGTGKGSHPITWLTCALLAAAVLVLTGLAARFAAARRRPRGTLVVWRGSSFRLLDPTEVKGNGQTGPVGLDELFGYEGEPTGWSVSWTRRAPVLFGADGSAAELVPDETRTLLTTPPSTLTWCPDGTDSALSDEPPGRPASTPASNTSEGES